MQTTFVLEELARLTSYSKRTIRYYVQLGLVDRPIGEGRGSHYNTDHLRELLDIRKLTENGLSLEAVKHHLLQESLGLRGGGVRKPGTVLVQSRVCLAPGLDLLVTPEESALSPDDIRSLIRSFLETTKKFPVPPPSPRRQRELLSLSGVPPAARKGGVASFPPEGPPDGSRRN
ncbi:MAG: MerR family transcriptional regulator [Deltaproteobacteria bacterium]|jgi:DNA-binding transcriptional MerR regulator|nr:MerR family transcriptional regulator [Deltaproteobacteria bacterium]